MPVPLEFLSGDATQLMKVSRLRQEILTSIRVNSAAWGATWIQRGLHPLPTANLAKWRIIPA